jgi:hypothetical protein
MNLFNDRGIVVSYAIPFKRPTRARSLDVGTQPWSVDESRAIRKLCRMKSPELTTAFMGRVLCWCYRLRNRFPCDEIVIMRVHVADQFDATSVKYLTQPASKTIDNHDFV